MGIQLLNYIKFMLLQGGGSTFFANTSFPLDLRCNFVGRKNFSAVSQNELSRMENDLDRLPKNPPGIIDELLKDGV